MSVSVWRDASRESATREVDVAIVGGGVTGLAIARQCMVRGLVPAVLEARDVAAGASGRNAGFAMTGLADHYVDLARVHGRERAKTIWERSRANLRELVDDVGGREGIACDLVRCGSVLAAWDADEARRIAESHAMLVEDGFDVALLDAKETAARVGTSRFASGLAVSADHGVHPVKLVRGLAARVRDAGGMVLENHEVRAIEDRGDGRLTVRTTATTVLAPRVVIATNGYARLLDPWFAPRVRPVRGQVLATAPVAPRLASLLYTDDGFQYARQLADGTLVVGGFRRAFADVEVGYADETTNDVQSALERFVRETWPEAAGAVVTHRWSGVMGFSPDGLPLVGVHPERPGVSFAVGFTGHGLGFAFVTARALWNVLSGVGDAGIFDARRFDVSAEAPPLPR